MQIAPVNRALRWVITGFLVFFLCNVGRLASAQTESDLEGRFRKVSTFEIRPGIIVFPTYEADRAACRMVIEKRRYVDPEKLATDPVIPEMDATELFEELIPVEERGEKSTLDSRSHVAGGGYFFKKGYQDITLTMYGVSGRPDSGTRAVIIERPKTDCPPLKAESQFNTIAAFEIRPGINIFPTFAANGSVCRMIVEKRVYIDPHNFSYNNVIPVALAHQLVDELLPANERGTQAKYLSPESFFIGGAWLAKQDYKNVSVTMYGAESVGQENGTEAIVIEWPHMDCPPLKAQTKSE